MGDDSPALSHSLHLGGDRLPAWVFDGLVDGALQEPLFRAFETLPYAFADYDRADTANVRHLVHKVPGDAPEHPLGGILASLERTVQVFLRSEGHQVGERLRAYVNFNLYGDYQFAHTDGHQWTALLFGNHEWHEDWGGELLLYEDERPGGLARAIPPLPGRLVVFDGRILHRGGVPSKHCLSPRITLALKFARP